MAMSTGERTSWIVVVVGAVFVLAPWLSDAYLRALGNGAFALMMVGLLASLTAFVMVFFFRGRDRQRRTLLDGAEPLAHWTYTVQQWQDFAGGERTRQAGEKRSLLMLTGVIMIVVALPFVIFTGAAGVWVAGALFVTWILCWLAARMTLHLQAASRSGPPPEARIGVNGLLLGRELHIWRGWGSRLSNCQIEAGPPPRVRVTYSAPAGLHARSVNTVCVPIPPGREADAKDVVRRINAA